MEEVNKYLNDSDGKNFENKNEKKDKYEFFNNFNNCEIEINPILDIVYKKLFENEDNKDIFVHFLNTILKYYGKFNSTLNNLKINDKELKVVKEINENYQSHNVLIGNFKTKVNNTWSKDIIKIENEEFVDIEIQILKNSNFYGRSGFFNSILISNSILKEQQHARIPNIVIIILDY
eukprot:jgi/Orpsp1_1/1178246/evm.model.c7180000064582.1